MPTVHRKGLTINELFRLLLDLGGSVMYLSAGGAPQVRLRGVLCALGPKPHSRRDLVSLLMPIMRGNAKQVLRVPGRVQFVHAVFGQQFEVAVVNEDRVLRVSLHLLLA